MGKTSLNNITQQVQRQTRKGTWQEILKEVRKAYASAVKLMWYESKSQDIHEINGEFQIPFENQQPVLNPTNNRYYIDINTSYLGLPQESGIVSVAYMSAMDDYFVLCNAGTVGRMNEIQAGCMGGSQLYYTQNDKMYFPRMNQSTALPINLILALGLDDYDVDAPINIPDNIQKTIVDMVVQVYTPVQQAINENIK